MRSVLKPATIDLQVSDNSGNCERKLLRKEITCELPEPLDRFVLHLPIGCRNCEAKSSRKSVHCHFCLLHCRCNRIKLKCWFDWKIIQINSFTDAPRTHTKTSDARVGFQSQSCCSAKTSCASFRAGINAFQPIKTIYS